MSSGRSQRVQGLVARWTSFLNCPPPRPLPPTTFIVPHPSRLLKVSPFCACSFHSSLDRETLRQTSASTHLCLCWITRPWTLSLDMDRDDARNCFQAGRRAYRSAECLFIFHGFFFTRDRLISLSSECGRGRVRWGEVGPRPRWRGPVRADLLLRTLCTGPDYRISQTLVPDPAPINSNTTMSSELGPRVGE